MFSWRCFDCSWYNSCCTIWFKCNRYIICCKPKINIAIFCNLSKLLSASFIARICIYVTSIPLKRTNRSIIYIFFNGCFCKGIARQPHVRFNIACNTGNLCIISIIQSVRCIVIISNIVTIGINDLNFNDLFKIPPVSKRHRINREMLRLKCNRLNTLFSENLHRLRRSFNRNYIVSSHFSLSFVFFGSGYIHNLHYIGFFTLLLNGRTSKGHLHRPAPNLIIQLMAVFIQQVNVIR